MSDTQISKFRQQYPQYDDLPDAAILTRYHQKYYSDIKYEDFVGKFETKFGGKQPKSFTDIAYDRTLKEPAKSAIDSPIGAGGEFLGNLFQFTGQTLPVAALPVGSNQYNIKAGEETFLQRLERGKMPGEILPSGQSGPGKAHTEALRGVINFFGDAFWAAPAVTKLFKMASKGSRVTRIDVHQVRKLLQSAPEVKQLGPLSDNAIIELVRRGRGEAGKVSEGFVGKSAGQQKQLPPGIQKLHAEGILEGQKKINALRDPVPKVKTSVTIGKFSKVEGLPINKAVRVAAKVEDPITGIRQIRAGQPGQVHAEIFSPEEIAKKNFKWDNVEHGFLDEGGRWMSREEAAVKAGISDNIWSGDVWALGGGKGKLDSGDLVVANKLAEIKARKPLTRIAATRSGIEKGSRQDLRKLGGLTDESLKPYGISNSEESGVYRQINAFTKAGGRKSVDDLATELHGQGKIIREGSETEGEALVRYIKDNKPFESGDVVKGAESKIPTEEIAGIFDKEKKLGALGDNITQGQFEDLVRTGKDYDTIPLSKIKVGDEFKLAGEKYTVKAKNADEFIIEDGTKKTVDKVFDRVTIDRGSLKQAKPLDVIAGKPINREKEFINEQAKKGIDATRPTVAARQRAREKVAEDVRSGKEDLFTTADKSKQSDMLSGREFTRGLFKSIGEDIKGTGSGIIADPYRNIKGFLKENKLQLTPDEMAKISNFARRLTKEGMAESVRVKRFEEYLGKEFPKMGFQSGLKPVEYVAEKAKFQKEATKPMVFEIGGKKVIIKEEVLNQDTHNKVVDAFGEVMIKHKIQRDPSKPLSDQFLDAFDKNLISFKDVAEHGVTEKEFLYEVFRIEDVSDAARKMQRLSQVSRKMKLQMSPDGIKVVDELADLAGNPDNKLNLTSVIKRIDNIRRGLLVTQLSTAVRNANSQVGRIGLDVVDEAIEIAIGKMFKVKAYDSEKFADAFKLVSQLSKKNKKVLEDVMQSTPAEFDRLFMHYASDVMEGSKTGKILGNAEKAVGVLNWANKLQEFTIRRAAFVGKLNELLGKRGTDFSRIYREYEVFEKNMVGKYGPSWQSKITNPELKMRDKILGQITKDEMKQSVDFSLEMTFAENPKYGTVPYNVLKAVNSMPMAPWGTGTIPFGRFMYNALKFNFQHSPLGFFRLMKPSVWKTGKAPEAIARATTGSMMLLAGHQIRNSKYAGDKWYELKAGGKVWDTRAYNPFSAYLFLGDVINRIQNGTIGDMTFKDWSLGILSSNLRAGTGLYMLDLLANSIGNINSAKKFAKMVEDYAGGIIGGFFTPIQQLQDFISEFDKGEAKLRNTRGEGLHAEAQKRIPFLSQLLPERKLPTRSATPTKDYPILKQVTGVLLKQEDNLLEREINRLGITYQSIYPRTGDEELNKKIIKGMGPLAESEIIPYLKSKEYRSANDEEKKQLIKLYLKAIRDQAKFQ